MSNISAISSDDATFTNPILQYYHKNSNIMPPYLHDNDSLPAQYTREAAAARLNFPYDLAALINNQCDFICAKQYGAHWRFRWAIAHSKEAKEKAYSVLIERFRVRDNKSEPVTLFKDGRARYATREEAMWYLLKALEDMVEEECMEPGFSLGKDFVKELNKGDGVHLKFLS